MNVDKSGLLIYLLEDDTEDAYLITKAIQSDVLDKHSIGVFKTLESLTSGLKNLMPELVIIDLNVPDSKGLDTMIKVKKLAHNVPIVVLTGIDDPKMGNQLVQLGAQDYIPKPEMTASLLQRVIRFSKERFKLIKALEESASRDVLTRLYNREALESKFAELISKAERYDEKFGIIFLDLNNFKYLNDTYGHRAGDTLLTLLGGRLEIFSRSSDFIARYGGDEFVTLLPNVQTIDECLAAAKSQLSVVCDDYFVESDDGVAIKVEVTGSMGVAIYGDHGTTKKQLLESADTAMYEAKTKKLGLSAAKSIKS
ncbi:GGDEF domain-containing response regulator [Psychrosphaera sp. B3R10]|uniref:GGDEF domain-containing response regulator n=1 Tax=unclassified Psychrosphaera TaxID=2641570 RepID=UPI001C086189|nr:MULTISPECIES: GGDEF domain-containing response regulator [unclassified Psychrosphaera]MBU2880851.1 GGDEF domain-containing response regulator [Psychrosphaera sp. I2R16]MBU2990930.1 GGDEF domain-containing response regulator [Psychrosphaera sp. B3R10]